MKDELHLKSAFQLVINRSFDEDTVTMGQGWKEEATACALTQWLLIVRQKAGTDC